ncbi:unnamed protein product [Diatraea saccharalis]|uniref:Lipase n=1 Tax=Diatraea saccharalis TaxID=40085 RepID=A0A9N9N3I9_9NEOP|nr:unnamed protein product [Diatraea saccharalis]
MDKVEKRRKIIMKAFTKFLKEAVEDEVQQNSTTAKHRNVPGIEHYVPLNTFETLVSADGYKADSHIVITTDGYLLTLHRILSPSPNVTIGRNGIVLLHHGILGSSDDWILLGPKKSLPYLLIAAGYDVWLVNARGNKYSRTHIKKDVNDDTFWDFSWHEIGLFDLAAVIDYIKDRNDNDVQLNFIGYSMGATALLVLLSVLPEYNFSVKIAILLAPLVFMHEVKGPLQLIAEHYNSDTLRLLGIREHSPLQELPPNLVKLFCEDYTNLCHNILLLLANGAQKVNEELSSKILTYTPGGSSTKTIVHYIQSIKSGQFRMFDMDIKKNFMKYGSSYPPAYNLQNVRLPIVLFFSTGDWLSSVPDIETLLSYLPYLKHYHNVASNDFDHLDFMWSNDADVLVYYIILEILNQAK